MLCFSRFFLSSNGVFLCGFVECVSVLVRFALHCYKIKVFKHDIGHYREYVVEK